MKINHSEFQAKVTLFANSLQQKRGLMAKLDQHNAEQIEKKGKLIKYDPENVLHIEEINGKIVFLERGAHDEEDRSGAGYKHILRHADEFVLHNIPIAKLPSILFSTLKNNRIIGYQGRGTGRPIYESDAAPLAITVGSNGFIVGANPTSTSALKK